MKKIILSLLKYIFLFSWLIGLAILFTYFPAPSVSAQSPTLSPTNTFIPPTATPTSINLMCPIGTPAGYGTYTPSPLWLLECSQCAGYVGTPTVSVTPSPSPTHDGTGTPYPTSSPTYTPSPTFTPTPVSSIIECGSGFLSCVEISPYHIQMEISSTITNVGHSFAIASGTVYYVRVEVHFDAGLFTYNNGIGGYPPLGVSYSSSEVDNEYVYADQFQVIGSGNAKYYYVPAGIYEWENIASGFNEWKFFMQGGGSAGAFASADGFTVDITTFPYSSGGTPTPTPTGILPNSYCSSLAPVTDDFGFDLFIADGAPNCNFGWDEFGAGEYTVPAVQICLQPVQVGVIRLFGDDYEVGIYILAVLFAFIYRFMRTV